MRTINAIVKDGSTVALREVPCPAIQAADEVRIQIQMVGLCRTDLYITEGQLPCCNPLIPGHEFSGTVLECGSDVETFQPGDRVTVMPVLPCKVCPQCQQGLFTVCQQSTMLGVDRNGAFAEQIVVPQSAVHRLPDSVTFQQGAYAEPIAAAMAITHSGIRSQQNGIILGQNRFSRLVEMVLQAKGFSRLTISPYGSELPPNHYDFGIETQATPEALSTLINAIRPLGTLVVRSRPAAPVPLDLRQMVLKELTVRAVNYGPFSEGLALLEQGLLPLDDCLGPVHPLKNFQSVFEMAKADESTKHFFFPVL